MDMAFITASVREETPRSVENMGDMILHGPFAKLQLVRDLFVGESPRSQGQHFLFPDG